LFALFSGLFRFCQVQLKRIKYGNIRKKGYKRAKYCNLQHFQRKKYFSMCWYVYIATSEPLKDVIFTENLPKTGEQPPPLHFQAVIESEKAVYGHLFKHPYLYYVGSDTGCSCGLEGHYTMLYYSDGTTEKEWSDETSPRAFLEFLKSYTQHERLEMYVIYETERELMPLQTVEIHVQNYSKTEYVELKTRQFYILSTAEK
jgi:hypothetical protein